jgi:tRNA 2-thiouridine synthesizing protein A
LDEELEPEEQIKLEDLLRNIGQLREAPCQECGTVICGHEALMSFALGFKDEPKCWTCLAHAMGHQKEVLRDHVFAYIRHRSCHHEGWRWASREEGYDPEKPPNCLWPANSAWEVNHELSDSTLSEKQIINIGTDYDVEWDAGDTACGDLLLELRIRMQSLQPGQILKLIATDSGASEDIPAWCRITKHSLLYSQHPVYLIQRKTKHET